MPAPNASEVADRALVLYAVIRRGTIELALEEFGYEERRMRQAEQAREETDRWLARESLDGAVTVLERRLFEAVSGSWPREAVTDGIWKKESLAVLLWVLQHTPALPPIDEEAEAPVLDAVITRYGSVSSFRSNGRLREVEDLQTAWLEADAWLGATEGGVGDDAVVASIAAERFRSLAWLRDAAAATP